MSIEVCWQHDCQFEIETEQGFKILADANGKEAPCPTEILLSALGSCSATDVVLAIEEAEISMESLTNQLTYTLTEKSPRLYKTVNLHFIVKSPDLTDALLNESIQNAINKYCHVCLMLQPQIEITFSSEINH